MFSRVVVCLMGPTASGKTDIAIRLSTRFPVELVSVDSALVYRGMDIGTAKPDTLTLKKYPHALIDIVDPEPHLGNRAPGLYMNVGGSLLEGILQQPVNDFDHMLVVGVRIFAGAQVQ